MDVCRHNSLTKIIMQGKVEVIRDRVRPKKDWKANITKWIDKTIDYQLMKVKDKYGWRDVLLLQARIFPLR